MIKYPRLTLADHLRGSVGPEAEMLGSDGHLHLETQGQREVAS